MLQIIKNALNTVRLDPDHGELMYQILYLTYFSERKLANREAILAELERIGFQMSMVTYHSYLNMAIKAIDRILWGYQIINRADVGGQYLNEWQTAKATWVTTVCRFNNNPLPKTGY